MPNEEPRFSSAEVNLVIHATEDQDKVLAAVEKALAIPAADFQQEPSEGHFGNRIISLKTMVASSRQAGDLAARIISMLNSADRQHLSDMVDEYSDERGNLYLRLDKQRLCQGKATLAEADSVRFKFKPVRRYKPSGNIDSYRGLLSSIE
jgi:RNA binding exosome subunit